MPLVLKHNQTSELFACHLVNKYELRYYGLKMWDDKDEAEQEREPFLRPFGLNDADAWQIHELDEGKIKLGNVKLKNDSSNRVFLGEDGVLRIEKRIGTGKTESEG